MAPKRPYEDQTNQPGEGDGPMRGQGDGSTMNDPGTQAETADGIGASDSMLAKEMVDSFNSYTPGKPKYQGFVDVAGTTQDGSADGADKPAGDKA